jgi:hypothetical protein
MTVIGSATLVRGRVNYLGEMTEHPVFYAKADDQNNLNLEEHEVAIADYRGRRKTPGSKRADLR